MDETRLDADPAVQPDIVAEITNLGDIGRFDLIYCSHTLEHVYQHQVAMVLSEFKRVLRDGGAAIITVPDLTDVKCDDTIIYESYAGPITGRDMYYGLASFVEANPLMAHKTGFTRETLKKALEEHFHSVRIISVTGHNIIGIGAK